MIEAAVRAVLLAAPGVAALVGDRIYAARIPQRAAYPAITISRANDRPNQSHRGLTGLTRRLVQVSAWAVDADGSAGQTKAETIDAAVVRALGGYRGTVMGVVLQAVIADNGSSFPADPEAGLWHAPRTFIVIAREGA